MIRALPYAFGAAVVATAMGQALSVGSSIPARVRVAPNAKVALAEARKYLGGGKALEGVSSLDVSGIRTRLPPDGATGAAAEIEPFRFRLLRPDCFQRVNGDVVHTLSGGRFWQRPSFAADVMARAERNTKYDFAFTSTLFLLQPTPIDVDVTDLGVQVVGQTRGRVLHYRSGNEFDLRLVLHERTYQPLAFATTGVLRFADGSRGALNVRVVSDYRDTGQIKAPFRIDETLGGFRSHIVLDRVAVNTLVREDFAER